MRRHFLYLLQMDPPSRFESTKTADTQHVGETELDEVQVIATPPDNSVNSTPATLSRIDGLSCRNGGCKIWRSRDESPESPWHTLKTVFLVSVIVAFFIWILVYTLLDQYRIL